MIEANLKKSFRGQSESAPFALNVRLEAGNGITVLFGPSGAGKTLTLDLIAGFTPADEGRIVLDEEVLFDSQARINLPARSRRAGYVFQNYALFPHMTLRQNLDFAAQQRPGSLPVTGLLDRFRLTQVAGRYPSQLSGGQKQRGSIARALVGQPRLLLLDEPSRGLDAPLRQELYSVLSEVRTPVLLVTHDLDECYALADRMLVMREGRVAQSGTPREVAEAPATAQVARLLGTYNVLAVEILAQGHVRWGAFDLALPFDPRHHRPGRHAWLAIEYRHLRARPLDSPLGPNEIAATLQHVYERHDGIRVEFSRGLLVEMPAIDRQVQQWAVEFPAPHLQLLH